MSNRQSSNEVGGLLAVWVRISASLKPDFERWYDEEHLPERRSFPGFLSAERFDPVDGGEDRAALYELTRPDVFHSPEYEKLRTKPSTAIGERVRTGWQDHQRVLYQLRSFHGGDLRPMQCPVVVPTRTYVKEDHEEEMRSWLEEEHVLRQLELDDVISYQGFEALDGPFHFLNLWGVEHAGVVNSDAWIKQRDTPRRQEIDKIRERAVQQFFRLP